MRKRTCGIYAIVNTVNSTSYIGSSVHIERRWALHRHELLLDQHHSRALQRAWKKYGAEAFEFRILEVVTDPLQLLTIEQGYLDATKRKYNCSPTAGSNFGYRHRADSRAKMSARKKGIIPSIATAAAADAIRGTTRSEAFKANISVKNSGRKRPDLAERNRSRVNRDKVSKSLKGRAPLVAVAAASAARRQRRLAKEQT